MKAPHLNGLRALEVMLRNGTFTAAADELGVTVPAIGQQAKGPEDYLGLKLFERLPSGAWPAENARAVAASLTVGFVQLEDAFANLARRRNSGRLRIALSHLMLGDWLAERMRGFCRKHPGTDVAYDVGEGFGDLFKGDVDMAIRFSPEPGPEYEYERPFRTCFMPLSSRSRGAERHSPRLAEASSTRALSTPRPQTAPAGSRLCFSTILSLPAISMLCPEPLGV